MDSPTRMSAEFGRRLFFFITIALPWEDDSPSAILDTLCSSPFCCFVDQTATPAVAIIPRSHDFVVDFPGHSRNRIAGCAAGSGVGQPGQFNGSVERRHVL